MSKYPISMDSIAQELNSAGYSANIYNTGGGVATLYVEPVKGNVYPLVVGPGYFETDGSAWLDRSEICYGRESADFDECNYLPEDTEITEEQLVSLFFIFLGPQLSILDVLENILYDFGTQCADQIDSETGVIYNENYRPLQQLAEYLEKNHMLCSYIDEEILV